MSIAPVRVALVTPYYHPVIGGVETTARQLAAGLEREGLSVRVLTRRTPATSPVRDVIDGIAVHRLRPSGDRNGAGKWLMLPALVWALIRQRQQFDIIVVVDFRGVGVGAVIAGWLLRKPVILQAETPHALSGAHQDSAMARFRLPSGGVIARSIKGLLRRFYRAADAHVCISREIETEARAHGVQRLAYIPHGVDLDRFRSVDAESRRQMRTRLGWPADHVMVVFVGRLSREKGVLDLLDAWTQVKHPRMRLVIVGPDMLGHLLDAGPEVRRVIEERALSGTVRLHGPADPAPLLPAADVMVQPSHWEAFGQSALEAIAAGVPVVASRTGGLPDFLHHRENALLFEPGDVGGLAAALQELVDDEPLRRRMGRRGREIAETRFSLAAVAARYAEWCRRFAGNLGGFLIDWDAMGICDLLTLAG